MSESQTFKRLFIEIDRDEDGEPIFKAGENHFKIVVQHPNGEIICAQMTDQEKSVGIAQGLAKGSDRKNDRLQISVYDDKGKCVHQPKKELSEEQ